MTLPHSVVNVLLGRGVRAEVVARLDDLHRLLGYGAVEAFASVLEEQGRPSDQVEVSDLEELRPWLGRRFLEAHHAGWLASCPSPGFWRHRTARARPLESFPPSEGWSSRTPGPLGAEIAALHDRTVNAAATALGLRLGATRAAELPEGVAELAKLRLAEALEGPDRDALIWRVEPGFSA